MDIIITKPNSIGALASTICLVHCIATPLIFSVSMCIETCCETTPLWWKVIDYIFLIVAFFAVYKSVQSTTRKWMKVSLFLSWFSLLFVIVNEQIELLYLTNKAIYIPTLSLILLHIYNQKYCQCNTEECCVNLTK